MKIVYEARSALSENNYFVSGPSTQSAPCAFKYYGGTLDPASRFDDKEQALKAARLCNIAFSAGYAAAMADIRKLLSLTEVPTGVIGESK